jgi:uncharacterized protein YbjT (DUF2867 family)
MQSKIAIVGANGFVGRHLVDLLAGTGRPVAGIVRSETGARLVEKLGGTPVRVKDLHLSSTDALIPALANCDGLVYTASVCAGPDVSDRSDPTGLINVLRACLEAGVPRFVFLSGLGIAHYGMNPHCTNSYFLGKMAGEVALFRSGLITTVFRPSYIFGEGDEFLSPLIRRIAAASQIEIPGSGEYRLQPISVRDTARAILSTLDRKETTTPRVLDLVGPEAVSYAGLIGRIASIMGRRVALRERPVHEALAEARTTGYYGLNSQDLACLLCDEVSDPAAVESALGGRLESVEEMIRGTIAALQATGAGA